MLLPRLFETIQRRTGNQLYGQVAFSSQVVRLSVSVAPSDIATFIGLEFPRGHNHDVSFSYPNSTFHLATDTAQTFLSILAFDHYAIETKQFRNDTQNLALRGINHLTECAFA